MLEVKGLTKKYYSIPVVKNVSFRISPGEIVGYLGPNGAGKTTTIKMLAGLVEPTEGKIFFNGEEIWKDINKYKERIGYLPENPELYPHLTAYEYLLLVGRLRKIKENLLKEKINGFMKVLNLENDMHSPISSYSKGMKQKVLLTSSLLHNPELLLLDEPLSGLDLSTSLIFRELLNRLSKEGKIILLSSHIMEEIEKVASRVIIIHNGSILADDKIENLMELTKVESLEEVFQQIVLKEDPDKTAEELVEIVKYE
jgi:ABC-2 type transport system ATP-binding protein